MYSFLVYSSDGAMSSSYKFVETQLVCRFERYASPDTKQLNIMGWRYFIMSCLGLELSEDDSRALFQRHAADGA